MAREILDRVVASLGNDAITESDVVREYRFELFLDGKSPDSSPDPEAGRRVLDQLIDQRLLLREANAERWEPGELMTAAEARLAEVRKTFKDEEAFQSALRFMNMDKEKVLTRLEEQERSLRLIDRRFRPSAWVEDSEVETYYRESFAPEYTKRSGRPAPPVAEVEAEIKEILVQKKIDQLLSAWLKELKGSRAIRLHEF